MCETGRAKAYLGVSEAQTHGSQHRIIRHEAVIEINVRMSSGNGTVHGMNAFAEPDAGVVEIDQEHGGAGRGVSDGLSTGHHNTEGCAIGAAGESLMTINGPAAVDLCRLGKQGGRIGTGAGVWLCHSEAGSRRAGGQRRQVPFFLCIRGDQVQHVHIAFIRRHAVERGRADRGISGFLEDRGPVLNGDALAAEFPGNVRGKDPGGLRRRL